MARLDLKFVGLNDLEGAISVNDKLVKLNKNDDGSLSYTLETDTNVDVSIYKGHRYLSKRWFWWNLLYFFISIFGIFDTKHNKKCLVLYASFNISAEKDSKIVISRQDFEDGAKFVNVDTDAQIEEISNVQYYDQVAKKRHSKMKLIKFGIIALSVVLTAVLVILL